MHGPIAQLGQKLLETADPALLDLPLDALDAHTASDEARTLLHALHASGDAHTLRDALSTDQLARWVADTCTSSEERALTLQLQRWLGRESAASGPDDPARLVTLEALPSDPEALVDWARRHGVASELMRPSDEVVADTGMGSGALSVLEACCPDYAANTGFRASDLQRLASRAREYLRSQAADARALTAREALWSKAWPENSLRLLAERLRALLPADAPGSLHAQRFVSGRPVALDTATGVCRGVLHRPAQSVLVQLWLSGYEHRALDSSCDACARGPCVHRAALAGRLLDACLDPEDRLHAQLREFTRVPSWQRFVAQLHDARERERTPVSLVFALRMDGPEQCSIGVLKRDADAADDAPGKLASPQRLLRAHVPNERDRAALSALAARTRTLSPQYVSADLSVLRSLVGHPEVQRASDGKSLQIVEEQLSVNMREAPEGLVPSVTLCGEPVHGGRQRDLILREDGARGALVFASVPPGLARLLGALEHFRGVLPKESYAALAPQLSRLRPVARVSAPNVLLGYEHPAPHTLLLRISPLPEAGVELGLYVRVFALSPLWKPGEGDEQVEGLVDGAQRFSRRDLARERALAREVIEALGLDQHTAVSRAVYQVNTHAAALEVLSRAAQLSDRLQLEWAHNARQLRITQTLRPADLHIRLFKRGHWLELAGAAKRGGSVLALDRLLDSVRRGERFVRVDGDDFVEIERSLFSLLEDAQLSVHKHDRQLALALAAAPRFLQRFGEHTRCDDPETRAWLTRLPQREHTRVTGPLPLEAQLREYQREGVRWLLELAGWAQGACLADDMGLGKTIQATALLLARASDGPALVVAPTSLLSNWQAELARFAPELRALVYRGPERERLLGELGPHSVLITSYELLLRDRARLGEHVFGTQIIDEAQTIRNARTSRAQAVAGMNAAFRLALTGTPIENRLGDLWSLFALIAPGLLGSWARFRALFAVPIERYEDRERASRLRSLIEPFMLRRTKDQVAPELPARTEVLHAIELSAPERALYAASLAHARNALGKRKRKDLEFTVHILAELTRLRQLACHPRLVIEDSRIESSKQHALMRLLEDLVPRGHRVLIFSQFTKHLGLVRDALEARGLTSLYLDGSTPAGQRAQLIEQFQAGAAPIFLISLKAGGTGLNLTAADYVVHLDPWWNPAALDQASDRAHRIGQVRPVTIVKLIAQDTIEERVLGLHEHKRRLALDMLSAERANFVLDQEALEALLAD